MNPRKKILLVDDDEAVVSYLVVKLARYYELISTTRPLEAVALAAREQPDLILCDIDMPGMSGGDLAAALTERPETAFIPVLYLTSLVSPEEAQDLDGEVGGRPGVSKRAPLAELLQRIDELTRPA
ncbi:MAG: response regulator [Ramlibacter sp.]|nr:response regulator [Ramlibacter sp.]MBX3656926.1 response regulator [Ramlibacter sp.]MCW5651578.1 response regulator [Ramlibacter sp.]